ncbi:MAG: hypothetical protein ACREP9_07430, partial [Candidatus Dormibacteraceae bacterium]
RSLSVISSSKGAVAARRWTVHDIQRGWSCARLDAEAAARLLEEPYWPFRMRKHGTLVVWDELDKLEPRTAGMEQYLQGVSRSLAMHLGLCFHRLLTDGRLRITLDTQHIGKNQPGLELEVKPIDPVRYGQSGAKHYPKEFVLDMGKLGKLPIQAHIWPPRSKGVEYKLGGKAAARQGFYFYRNDRLIQAGGWSETRQDGEPHLSLARVAVTVPPRLDSEFSLNMQKSAVDVPNQFIDGLARVRSGGVSFADYLKEAQTTYRRRTPASELTFPVVLGPGVPVKVRKRAERHFGEGARRVLRISLKWKDLDPVEIFRIDREGHRILLNRAYQREISSVKGKGEELLKASLYLLLRDEFQRQRLSQDRQDYLDACNDVLLAALSG